eukprot:g4124.t1
MSLNRDEDDSFDAPTPTSPKRRKEKKRARDRDQSLVRSALFSHVGKNFREYAKRQGLDIVDAIPQVQVCVKVLSISYIDIVQHTFRADLLCMYDWEDKSVLRYVRSNVNKEDTDIEFTAIDFDKHFVPCIEYHNAQQLELVGGLAPPRLKDLHSGRVTITQRVSAVFRTRYDLRLFPFDSQILEIRLKSKNVHHVIGHKSANVQLENPVTWRGKKGHSVSSEADWLAEWDIATIDGAPDGKHHSMYRIQVCVLRDSSSTFSNLVLPLATILLLSFTAYFVPAEDIADRLQISVTMLLTTMTFKFILSDILPSVPYRTVLDNYVIRALMTISLQGVGFCLTESFRLRESWIRHSLHIHEGYSFLDHTFMIALILWQFSVHAQLYRLHRQTNMTNFMDNLKMTNCIFEAPKNELHTKSASYLMDNDIEEYQSKTIYRPYKHRGDGRTPLKKRSKLEKNAKGRTSLGAVSSYQSLGENEGF